MAAFNRPTEASYMIHESVHVDTLDNEDHTFCGIMFPIKCKELLPVDHISIRSIAIRGQLGPLTVWISKLPEELPVRPPRGGRTLGGAGATAAAAAGTTVATANNNNNTTQSATSVFRLTPSHWHKLYEAVHQPSQDEYVTLKLTSPIILKPGQIRAIYIHSTLPGDQAIVYDNASFYMPRRGAHHFHGGQGHEGGPDAEEEQRKPRYEDSMLSVYTGRAHVSNAVFGQMPIWGWGNAWRDHREFVGQLDYGAVYQLWNPETKTMGKFGPHFKEALFNLKLCQTRWESPVSKLPDECIYYILNMCRWDWFEDSTQTMTTQKAKNDRKQKEIALKARLEQEQVGRDELQREAVAAAVAQQDQEAKTDGDDNNTPKTNQRCPCPNNNSDDDDDDEALYDDDDDDDDDDSDCGPQEAAARAVAEAFVDGEIVVMSEDEDEWMEDDGEDDDDEDDDEEDEDEDDESWERANGYRADHNSFRFVDPDREEEAEEENNPDEAAPGAAARQAWIRRQFERIHVLRALAQEQDDGDDVEELDY